MVPAHGFEPQSTASEAGILPLDEKGKLMPVFRLGKVAQPLFSAPIAIPLCGVILGGCRTRFQTKKPESANTINHTKSP